MTACSVAVAVCMFVFECDAAFFFPLPWRRLFSPGPAQKKKIMNLKDYVLRTDMQDPKPQNMVLVVSPGMRNMQRRYAQI